MNRLLALFFLIGPLMGTGQIYDFLNFIPRSDFHEMRKVQAVALHPEGDLFFADEAAKSIRVFKTDGEQKRVFNSVQSSSGKVELVQPRKLFVDFHKTLYIYDAGLGKIIILPEEGVARTFGEKGSKPGQLGDVLDLTVDAGGYIYVLNGGRKQVDVYLQDGTFLTWISGGLEAFNDPVSIGVSGRNELHVLERKFSDVIVFDANCNFVRRHRSLSTRPGVSLSKPVGLEVLRNGDFLVLDEVSCVTTQFDVYGTTLGTIGSRGDGSRGTFRKVSMLAASPGTHLLVAIFDPEKANAQVFSVNSSTPAQRSEIKRPQLIREHTPRLPMVDLASAPNGYRYVINAEDRTSVVAYQDSGMTHAFTLSNRFKEAVNLAVDAQSNVYIVDRKGKEIFVFDTRGVLLRSFGKEIPGKLKEPTGIAIQSNGTVLVADHGTGTIHAWSNQGIYQRAWVTAANAKWKAPFHIDIDSRDQIYVWDNKMNAVYRVGANGWPVAMKVLRARSFKPKVNTGVIGGMVVDGFDQVILYNQTTSQIEVYSWEVEPVLRFTRGRAGTGNDAFAASEGLVMDSRSFRLYLTGKGGKAHSAWHFLVKPPTPEDSYIFDSAEGKLIVFFTKLNVPYVTGYGLLSAGRNAKDSLVARTTLSSFTIDNTIRDGEVKLKKYQLVSISQSNISDPTAGFEDYFTFANQLLAVERYDEALLAFQNTLDRMGKAEKFVDYISRQLTRTGKMLAQRGDVSRAMPYLRLAHSVSPNHPETISAYKIGFAAYFQQMINREDIDGIFLEAERLLRSEALRPILLSSIDSVSQQLSQFPTESSISNALALQKKLTDWDGGNPDYQASLAATTFQLYRFKKNIGATSVELEAILQEADRNVKKAIGELKRSNKPWFEAELVQVHILNAQRKFEDAEFRAVAQLSQSAVKIPKTTQLGYRLALCESYKGRGRPDLAVLEYERILGNDPQNLEVKLLLADALTSDKGFDEARQIYQQLLLNDRNNADYIAQIGRIELLRGNFVEASFQLERAIREDPSERSYYGPLAEAFDGANNYQKALENYQIAIQYEESRLDQARRRLSANFEVTRVQADLEKYLTRSARIHELLSNYPAAIGMYDKLIAASPSSAEAHYGMGLAQMSAGTIYDAEKSLAQAARLDPSNQVYSNAHSNVLRQRAKSAANQPALNILSVSVPDVFPSLYRNYADVGLLPIGEVVIANNTDGVMNPSSISVFVRELMNQPTQVPTHAILGYSNAVVKLNAIFDERILSFTMDQPMQAEVEVNYIHEGKAKSSKKTVAFTLRNRNAITWSDKRRLAAFVAPGIPELIDYNRDIDQVFQESYARELNRTMLKALQVYTVLNFERYTYTPDPAVSFASASANAGILDNLQYPAETMMRKRGDCDDFVALYAGILENGGIATAYVDVPGHVFAAFDSQVRVGDLAASGLSPRDVIIQHGRVWIPVETTLIGTQNFMIAWRSAADRYYRELQLGNFPEVVPLADARNVYVPSNYVPQGFRPKPVKESALMADYNKVLAGLIAKMKREVIRETESRYISEPGNIFVKNKYAILLAQTGEKERAEGILLEALELSPNNPSVLNNLGNIYFVSGDGVKAAGYYMKAAQADRGDAEIRINLCKAYLLAGDKPLARQWLEKAIEMEPGLSSVYDYLKSELK